MTDEEWELVKDCLPIGKLNTKMGGRPRVDNRTLLKGMLRLLRTGAPWEDLPARNGLLHAVEID